MQGAGQAPLLWSVKCQPNNILIPVSVVFVVVTVWHEQSSVLLSWEEHSAFSDNVSLADAPKMQSLYRWGLPAQICPTDKTQFVEFFFFF